MSETGKNETNADFQGDTILVVDDNPANLGVIVSYFEDIGFEMSIAKDGETAIKRAKYIRPDIILLDVMMPGMDGFETCRRLKSDETLKDIPVIFMTALTRTEDKIRGFTAGGVDYITKPVNQEEVLVRVTTHLNIRKFQSQIEEQNEQLRHEIDERKKSDSALVEKNKELTETLENLRETQDRLIQSEKMVALGQLIAGVAHEINTPLGAIRASVSNISDSSDEMPDQFSRLFRILSGEQRESFFELIRNTSESETVLSAREERKQRRSLARRLEDHGLEDADTVADTLTDMGIYNDAEQFLPLLLHPENELILQTAYNITGLRRGTRNITIAAERASKVVFALKNYARFDSGGEPVPSDLTESIETVLTLYHNQLKHGIELIRNYEKLPPVLCHPDELNQVWTNLVHNAVQAMEGKGTLEISVFREEENAVVRITDSGRGIPGEIKDRIFDPFFTTKGMGEGSGLGLDIVQKIIDRHQGNIEMESRPGKTVFSVFLPISEEK